MGTNVTDRAHCVSGETVTNRMFVEGSSGLIESGLQALACGSNSGCKGKCVVMSLCE